MKETITHLAGHIIDLAGEIGTEAEALADVDPDIGGAVAVAHLREAQRSLEAAKGAITRSIERQSGDPVADSEKLFKAARRLATGGVFLTST